MTLPKPADQSVYRVFEISRHAGPLDISSALSASEQMFFFEAPLAHVVAWQVEQLMLLSRRASGETFSPPQTRHSLVPLGWATEAFVRALVR